jgi:hypothetical protein
LLTAGTSVQSALSNAFTKTSNKVSTNADNAALS